MTSQTKAVNMLREFLQKVKAEDCEAQVWDLMSALRGPDKDLPRLKHPTISGATVDDTNSYKFRFTKPIRDALGVSFGGGIDTCRGPARRHSGEGWPRVHEGWRSMW